MRFGIIGSGKIVQAFLRAAQTLPQFTLAAVYSRSQQRAEEMAARYGAALAFSNLEAFAQSDAFEAVYIASPNACHHAQSLQMLRVKKHVLCEKPMATNGAELDEMFAAARENGCLLLEAMRPLHAPCFAQIRQLLPRLGPLRRACFTYNQYSSRYDNFKAGVVENAFNPALGGGALMDIGVYPVHIMAALWGKPQRLQAACVRLPNGLDGQGFILAEYEGMLAELSYSKISDACTESAIQGEAGSLVFSPLTLPARMRLCLRGQPPQEVSLAPLQDPFDMACELEAFIRLAAQPEKAAEFEAHSRAAMAVLDEVRALLVPG